MIQPQSKVMLTSENRHWTQEVELRDSAPCLGKWQVSYCNWWSVKQSRYSTQILHRVSYCNFCTICSRLLCYFPTKCQQNKEWVDFPSSSPIIRHHTWLVIWPLTTSQWNPSLYRKQFWGSQCKEKRLPWHIVKNANSCNITCWICE